MGSLARNTKNKQEDTMISIKKSFMLLTIICSVYSIHAMDNKSLIHITPTHSGGLTIQLDQEYEFPCSDKKRNEIIKKILNQPEAVLKENVEILDKLDKLFTNTPLTLTPQYFYKISQSNPVWSLNECTGYCSLNRLTNPNSRKSFETIALQHINTHCPHKEELLVYTSFATGYLFADFVMLTKLIENGYKHIYINLIDTIFDEYIKIIQHEHVIQDNFFDKLDKLLNYNYEKSFYMRLLTYRIIQLLSWLKKYEDVHLTLHLYPNIDSYQKDCLKNEKLKANVLLAIDWLDDFSANESTFLDLYYTGVFKTLNNNGLFCSCKDSNRSFSSENLFTFWLVNDSKALSSTNISFSTDTNAGEKYANAMKQYCTRLTSDIL